MMNDGDLAKTIIDQNHNATWSGSIYALKDLLMFVNNNQDIGIKSKVIIKRQIEYQIKRYTDLKNNTEIGKKLNEISKKTGFDIT
tara:strand:+ start:110 stop:364 length:255 start_codon:yes stop_codon:yes gene_type:complete